MNSPAHSNVSNDFHGHVEELPGDAEIRKLKEIYWALRRGTAAIFLVAFAGAVAAYALSYLTDERFSSAAQVMIDTRVVADPEYTPQVSGLPTTLTSLQSELEVLRSTDLIERVVDRLNLTEDPEFSGQIASISLSPLSLLRALKAEVTESEAETEVDAAEAAHLLKERAIERVAKSRSIEQVGEASAVYKIRITSLDPQRSAAIANALAEEYLTAQREAKLRALAQAQGWLTVRTQELQEHLNKLAAELEDHALEAPFSPEEYATIKAQRVRAGREFRSETDNLSDLESRISGLKAALGADDLAQAADLADLPPGVPVTEAAVRSAMERLERSMEAVQERLDVIVALLDDLKADQARQAQHDAAAGRIKNEIAVTEAIYLDFVQQLSRRTQQDQYLEPDAQIIERARVPIESSEPNRALIAVTAGALAFFLMTGVVILREGFQNRLRTQREFEEYAGLPFAGSFPEVRKAEAPLEALFDPDAQAQPALSRFGRTIASTIDADPAIQSALGQDPFTGWPETRGAGSDHANPENEKCSIVLAGVSALPGEGQSTALVVLARSYAETGRKTIIVDCDPARSPYWGLSKMTKRLLERMRKDPGAVSRAILHTPVKGLDILPAWEANDGPLPRDDHSLTLLISSLQKEYDCIILDMPPVLASPDIVALLRMADGLVAFSRWNHTPRSALLAMRRILEEARLAPLFLVATRVNVRKAHAFGDPTISFEYRVQRIGQSAWRRMGQAIARWALGAAYEERKPR